MIRITLKDAVEAYRARTGVKLTYEQLSEITGLSAATLQSIASRHDYNPRLSTISILCDALDCDASVLLKREIEEN